LLDEKISAFASILTFLLSPFILVAPAVFIRSIILSPNLLMLYLSVIILIPFTYAITVPLFIKQMTFRETMYYYISYAFYLTTNLFMNILTYMYAIINMDKLTWGKTRQIIKNKKEFDEKFTQTDDIYGIYIINDNNNDNISSDLSYDMSYDITYDKFYDINQRSTDV
jgi:hypothetical protein